MIIPYETNSLSEKLERTIQNREREMEEVEKVKTFQMSWELIQS